VIVDSGLHHRNHLPGRGSKSPGVISRRPISDWHSGHETSPRRGDHRPTPAATPHNRGVCEDGAACPYTPVQNSTVAAEVIK